MTTIDIISSDTCPYFANKNNILDVCGKLLDVRKSQNLYDDIVFYNTENNFLLRIFKINIKLSALALVKL